jgi:UDP-glucose 4-epimerase
MVTEPYNDKPKTVLITGVAGLIGSRFSQYLIEKYPEVTIFGIDNLSGGFRENVNKKIKFFVRDLSDDLSDLFDLASPDYVFHFAAYAAEGLSPFIRKYNYRNNLVSTANIINECIKHNVTRLIFTSSMAVYGHGKPPFDEVDTPLPVDPYGIAKYACELDIEVAGEQHGLDWCIIRPHNFYGVNQNIWDKYRNVLGIWMFQYLTGAPMTIFGDGEQKRAFSFVDDCLESFWRAATYTSCSKEIINLGGTRYVTINQANKILRDIIGGGTVSYREPRHEVKEAHPTWKKSFELLGYEDKTPLEIGLKIMWEWAKTQPIRQRYEWEQYEIEKGIYQFWRRDT